MNSASASPSSSNQRHADVAIIGAGLAGLSAARLLSSRGYTVLVLEARERVGGRTCTYVMGDGAPIDLGGQWVGPMHRQMLALADELGVATFPAYDRGATIGYALGRRFLHEGLLPAYAPEAVQEVRAAIEELDRMAQTVPLDVPWRAPQAALWDTQTVADWLDARVSSHVAHFWPGWRRDQLSWRR